MPSFKRIINVIPITRVGLTSSQIFTYAVPLKLQGQLRPGMLVKIPFGQRRILGLTSSVEVHRLDSETQGLKNLEGIVEGTPVFSEKQLTLANWLAGYYVSPLGLVIKAMLPKIAKKSVPPDIAGYERYNPDFVLNEYQRQAVTHITNALGKASAFLLYGVTGSGKTEIYMRIIERLLESDKQVIILVPEISLTESAIERFSRRFGMDKIALLHSALADKERFWMWQQIRDQKKSIIIGPRSAVFAPVRDLGLIVLDEEHDSSFKQYDQTPKYHARTVAQKLSELWQCPLVLGDATPSVETYQQTIFGKTKLLSLPYRIKADVGLPKVKVVDMRQNGAKHKSEIFSEFLKLEILDSLRAKKQIILFLNRRGSATFVMCVDCGYVLNCKNCSVPLVWHAPVQKLLCHQCGKTYLSPEVCPSCRSHRIKHFGIGTQKVEEELKSFLTKETKKDALPVIVRMDSDTSGRSSSHSQIYKDWLLGKIRILIGTQMIGKGWDVSQVGLVGIISADTSLHLPDFRSGERTFQLLTQVAGRTGRGTDPGLVILQTYHPENYAIEAAKMHDYEKFFRLEIKEREKYGYPPFTRLVKLTIKHKDPQTAATRALQVVRHILAKREMNLDVVGPVPGFIPRLRGKYQYQVVLRFPREQKTDLHLLLQDLPSYADADVDPDTLL